MLLEVGILLTAASLQEVDDTSNGDWFPFISRGQLLFGTVMGLISLLLIIYGWRTRHTKDRLPHIWSGWMIMCGGIAGLITSGIILGQGIGIFPF